MQSASAPPTPGLHVTLDTVCCDAVSGSSCRPTQSPTGLVSQDDRVLTTEISRVATRAGPSLGICPALPTGVSANKFEEAVTHLPSLPAAAPSSRTPNKKSSRPPEAMSQLQLSKAMGTTASGGTGASSCQRSATQRRSVQSFAPHNNEQRQPRTLRLNAIRTVSHRGRSMSPSSPKTQGVSDIPTPTANRKARATVDPPKSQKGKSELVRTQNNEAKPAVMVTHLEEEEEVKADVKGDEETSISTTSLPMPNPTLMPTSIVSDPYYENLWVSRQDVEHSNNSSTTSQQADAVLRRYLDQTRRAVLDKETSETERVKVFDELRTRSRELFDLLDGIHNSFFDSPDPRLYSTLKVLPYDGALASSSNLDLPGRAAPGGAAGGVSSDDVTCNGPTEPLSLTTRTYATQLPPLGPSATLQLLNSFERSRRYSFNSCNSSSTAYIDIVNNYCILQLIGIGATGRTYLAVDRKTGNCYAMKTVAKRTRRSAARQLPHRPPSSHSDSSVLESSAQVASPLNCTTEPPQKSDGSDTTTSPVAASVLSVDNAASSLTPSALCAPSNPENCQHNEAKHQANQVCSFSEQGLRDSDMAGFVGSVSRTSNMAIPYADSVTCGDSTADDTLRGKAFQAVLMASGSSKPSAAQQQQQSSHSWKQKNVDIPRAGASSNGNINTVSTSPQLSSSSICSTGLSGQAQKEKSLAQAHVELSAVEREIRVMRRVQNHRYVAQLKEVIDDDDEDCAHLIMTYAANGPLTKVHSFDTSIGCAACNAVRPISRCARLLWQLADALNYVHRQHIVHNDVKPDNILLTESDNVLLTDFGESVLIPKQTQSALGAPQQPQQQQERSHHSPHGDESNATVAVPHNRWRMSRVSGDNCQGGGLGDFNEQSASHRLHGGNVVSCGGNLNGASEVLMPEASFRPDSSMFLAAGVDVNGRLNGDRIVLGSPAFAAPELIGKSTCSYLSDTWSFGVVMYAAVFGRLPFAGPSISDTFDEILHSPLAFPPLDDVPQNAELTEAAYDQWVLLCSQLLVREPQQRLSLNALMRHPFFRSVVLPPVNPKGTSGESPSSSSRSAATSPYLSPLSTKADRRPAQQSPRPDDDEKQEEDEPSPISRTTRYKALSEFVSPPMFSSSNRPPAPTLPRASSSASRSESSSSASKRIAHFSRRDDEYGNPLAVENLESLTQLPSLTPQKKSDTDAPPTSPAMSKGAPAAAAALMSSPSRHPREKTLVYVRPLDFGTSSGTSSWKDGSPFSISSPSNDYPSAVRREPSTQTPISAAIMLDCATDPSTTGGTLQMGKEETRRLGVNSRDPTSYPTALHPLSQSDSGGASRGWAASLLQQADPPVDLGDPAAVAAARTVNSSCPTLHSQDNRRCSASSPDVVTAYYSYWNCSEDEDLASGGSERKEEADASEHLMSPHTPHDAQIQRAPMRRGVETTKQKTTVVPVLSNREEVLGLNKRGKPLMARTTRETHTAAEMKRPPERTVPRGGEGSAKDVSKTSKESERGVAKERRKTSSRNSAKGSMPSSVKHHSVSSTASERKAKEVKLKQLPPAATSNVSFKLHH